MPITFPSKSNSGPPESPPSKRLSVLLVSSSLSITRPKRVTMPRSFMNPPGCPRAKPQSPTCEEPLSAILAMPQLPSSVILAMPASEISDPPNVMAFTSFPSGRRTLIRFPLLPMTWAAVRIMPSSVTMTPLPAPSPLSIATTALLALGRISRSLS